MSDAEREAAVKTALERLRNQREKAGVLRLLYIQAVKDTTRRLAQAKWPASPAPRMTPEEVAAEKRALVAPRDPAKRPFFMGEEVRS